MRVIPLYEKRQRGCQYCMDMKTIRHEGMTRTACPYGKCKYKVLDKYESYEEYMRSEDCQIQVDEFFKSFTGYAELFKSGRALRSSFSDGDDKTVL